jgi:hypothetical protein
MKPLYKAKNITLTQKHWALELVRSDNTCLLPTPSEGGNGNYVQELK